MNARFTLVSQNRQFTTIIIRTQIPAKLVYLGDIYLDGPNGRIAEIEETISHPKYNGTERRHDIALFRLNKKQNIDEFVRPACLADTFNVPNVMMQVTGWGDTKWNGTSSNVLQKVKLDYICTHEECSNVFTESTVLENATQICAISLNVMADTCSVCMFKFNDINKRM